MDYEQKYKDAMARLELVIRIGLKLDPAYIFPELAESEDEQIRKRLIEIVGLYYGTSAIDPERDEVLAWLEKQKEQKLSIIQWTGKNLKEVIDFTGKSPKFGEWFKSWEDFENYVHSHDDIFKLFCEDGSHYEVPAGAWIVKTPDGYNIPSRFRFVQKPAEWNYPYGVNETADRLFAIAECLEMDGNCLFNGYSGTECGKFLRELARKQVECKPAEWSEEDEEMLQSLILFIDRYNYFAGKDARVVIKWLKSLSPQPKQE